MENNKTWHEQHESSCSFGDHLADKVTNIMGSWRFIIIQTAIILVWAGINLTAYLLHWDPYPFILLNLVFSIQSAYAAPIIMMAQNRQSARDRVQANDDYMTNLESKREIEELQVGLKRLESEKLDTIIAMLQDIRKDRSYVTE
ncbi:DUF1003 domain-containing protein [Pontibacter liquoris]|uniref:DUF1003 domain-containing protein n=1 Tax=Pontibacter liquoris TaxID=2905677 RepID=UPI001FA748B0|nr:DUF1003 domain-containing protein [Pontibacter liquoris]